MGGRLTEMFGIRYKSGNVRPNDVFLVHFELDWFAKGRLFHGHGMSAVLADYINDWELSTIEEVEGDSDRELVEYQEFWEREYHILKRLR